MMRIALLGDVHANLPALEAVLAHAQQRGVEAIWNVGDWLGYGAFPNEVVARLRQENALSIIGNYDLKALQVGQEPERKAKKPEKMLAFRWSYETLSKENRKYLRTLSREVRLEAEGRRILLTHGSPASDSEYVTAETPLERLRELAQMANADIVICGHAHRPAVRKVDGVWFINTGSVGRPDDGDPRACYAILVLGPHYFRVWHYRVEYDVERAVAAIRAQKLPEAFAQMVLQGRSLEALQVVESSPLAADSPAEESAVPAERGTPPAVASPRRAVASGTEEEALPAVRQLAQSWPDGVAHAEQVTRLALRLFDELQPWHGLGPEARFWLQCAALLHDIGWAEGWQGHHKASLRLILEAPGLPLRQRERLIVASIARYHRRALPSKKHGHYAELKPADRRVVTALAALLRVADGLDCTHQNMVEELTVEVTPEVVRVRCAARGPAEEERRDAQDKGGLLSQVLAKGLEIEMALV